MREGGSEVGVEGVFGEEEDQPGSYPPTTPSNSKSTPLHTPTTKSFLVHVVFLLSLLRCCFPFAGTAPLLNLTPTHGHVLLQRPGSCVCLPSSLCSHTVPCTPYTPPKSASHSYLAALFFSCHRVASLRCLVFPLACLLPSFLPFFPSPLAVPTQEAVVRGGGLDQHHVMGICMLGKLLARPLAMGKLVAVAFHGQAPTFQAQVKVVAGQALEARAEEVRGPAPVAAEAQVPPNAVFKGLPGCGDGVGWDGWVGGWRRRR